MRAGMLWALLALAAAESEVSAMEDRHDRVKLCHRVVKDLAVREPQQLKDDIELAISASQEAFDTANATAAEAAASASEPAPLPEVLNQSFAIKQWTQRKMTNCMYNAGKKDLEDFKKPGGAFLSFDKVRTLSTHNASHPELLTEQGFVDLEMVLIGRDGTSTVGDSWGAMSTLVYMSLVIGALAYGSLAVVKRVTGQQERKKTPKELRAEEKKAQKKGDKDA